MARIADRLAASSILPADAGRALLVGRVWLEGDTAGPSPVLVRGADLLELSSLAPTVAQLLDLDELPQRLRGAAKLPVAAGLQQALSASAPGGRGARLLAPLDLQAIKASGVTFVASLL